jgi:orotidine-5'-phosphate decarboxylase
VVGATYPDEARALRKLMPDTIFLIPGYGAQGGSATDAAAGFRADGRGAIVNNSRGIIFAYKSKPYSETFGEKGFAAAARSAAFKMAGELQAVLSLK